LHQSGSIGSKTKKGASDFLSEGAANKPAKSVRKSQQTPDCRLSVRSSPRDPESDSCTFESGRFPGLEIIAAKTPSRKMLPLLAVAAAQAFLCLLPRYSDGIVQDSHLFPFYPQAANPQLPAPLSQLFSSELLEHENRPKATDTSPIPAVRKLLNARPVRRG
jgi:hypothetical protein